MQENTHLGGNLGMFSLAFLYAPTYLLSSQIIEYKSLSFKSSKEYSLILELFLQYFSKQLQDLYILFISFKLIR